MALKTYSAFNYGHTIVNNNRYINFSEDGGTTELSAKIDIGGFTLGTFASRIAKALNASGGFEYEVTLNRATRKYTISTVGLENFDLLIDSGTQSSVSAFSLMGFASGGDLTGLNVYEGQNPSGSQYVTQTPLLNFSDFINNRQKAEAAVNETPSGITEVISYSVIERAKMDFPLITDIIPQGYIRETGTGVAEARAFLDYAITKQPIEFIYSSKAGQENNYVSCLLDATGSNGKGVGFELKELYTRKLPFYYSITGIVLKKIEVS